MSEQTTINKPAPNGAETHHNPSQSDDITGLITDDVRAYIKAIGAKGGRARTVAKQLAARRTALARWRLRKVRYPNGQGHGLRPPGWLTARREAMIRRGTLLTQPDPAQTGPENLPASPDPVPSTLQTGNGLAAGISTNRFNEANQKELNEA